MCRTITGVNNPLIARQFDEAISWIGISIDNYLAERNDEGKFIHKIEDVLQPRQKRSELRKIPQGTGVRYRRVFNKPKE